MTMRTGTLRSALVTLVALVALCADPARAQTRVAQDSVLRASRLALGRDTLQMFLVTGDRRLPIGTVIDEIDVREVDGRPVLFRVFRMESALLGTSLDSLVDDAETLSPRTQVSRLNGGREAITYSPGRATGVSESAKASPLAVDVALPAGTISSSSFDAVLRSAPLTDGWRISVPTFVAQSRTVDTLTARVVGLESIDGERCWHVEADFVGMPVGFWIAERTRRLCRQEMRMGRGEVILIVPPIRPIG